MAAFWTVRRIVAVVVAGVLATSGVVVGTAAVASAAPSSAGTSEPSSFGVRTARSEWTAVRSILVVPTIQSPSAVEAAEAVSADDERIVAGDFLSVRAVRLEADAREAARLKAEHEAAAQAAADAAAAQAAARAVAAASSARVASAAGFVTHVWTSGFQAEINQCRGAVDVTAVYRVRVIAEHSNCGGSQFPAAAGAIVTITGLDAGRYRVIGVVARLNGLVNHAEDIPRGYDLLFQTCVAGFTDMRFIALSRIG